MSIIISKYDLYTKKIYDIRTADCRFLIFDCDSNSYGCKVDGKQSYAFACMGENESQDPSTEILSKLLITLSAGKMPEKMSSELDIMHKLSPVIVAVICMERSECRGHYVVDFRDDDIVIHGKRDSYLVTRKDEPCNQNYLVMAMSNLGRYEIMRFRVDDDEKPALAVFTAFMMDECVPGDLLLLRLGNPLLSRDEIILRERFGLGKIDDSISEVAAEDVLTAGESSTF